MQNFVAAVTHELRTPISTIQLHAEMLLEGWTTDPEVVKTYHARILRETKRLSTLVERVLEKSRLKERTTDPVRANLSEILQELEHDLVGVARLVRKTEGDLAGSPARLCREVRGEDGSRCLGAGIRSRGQRRDLRVRRLWSSLQTPGTCRTPSLPPVPGFHPQPSRLVACRATEAGRSGG
jgi:signal transduction histidine kinase